MKKFILLIITLCSIALLYAQRENNNKKLTNEEYFIQAELVVEGYFDRIVHTFDTGGKQDFDDICTIVAIKIQKVFKGELFTENIIYVVVQGGYLGEEKYGYIEDSNIPAPQFMSDVGIKTINLRTPAIFFLISSDCPDDENSVYFSKKKYKYLGDGNRLCIKNNISAGLNNLTFTNREELYNYMKQFDGFVIPEPVVLPAKPTNPNENQSTPSKQVNEAALKLMKISEPTEIDAINALIDSIETEMMKFYLQDSKKKALTKTKTSEVNTLGHT